jgi:hypothetical protein
LRWKIENEEFNTQKCGDYDLEHKYSRTSYKGLQNYYTCLQIAHAINQLLEHSRGGRGNTQGTLQGNNTKHLGESNRLYDYG